MVKNKKLEFVISISSSPGSFGETVHNAAYKYHSINYLYKAIKVKDLNSAIKAVRTLGIKGASISMPYKEKVMKLLDKVDPLANKAGAVNTILSKNNKLIGFNTDVYGAYRALKYLRLKSSDSVLILGAGGVARAIITALKKMKIKDITITNRNYSKSKKLANDMKCKYLIWSERNSVNMIVLINATSLGMVNNEKIPLDINSITNFNKVMDVVVRNKDTMLIKEAKRLNMSNVSGIIMTFYQAMEQYKIYTGFKAPIAKMVEAYNKLNNLKIKL